VIQASIASYYGFKMKLGDSFQYNNLKRQGWDTLLGNIPGVGMVADIIYKANRYNLKEMM